MRPDYAIAEQRLDNGLRIVVQEDHSVPAVAVNIWYAVGARHEAPDRTGLAHLFEHLMFQGSANVGPTEHFALLLKAGATLNGSTNVDRTNYYETVPAGALDLALWLEADRMGGLLAALTQDNLDNQRDVVKNERRQRYDNQPYGTASERLFALLFPPEHPYHHTTIGSMDHLDAATLADCAAFFRTYYAPDNAVLTLVGDVDAEATFAAAKRVFGSIPPCGAIPAAPDGAVGPRTYEARVDLHENVPAPALHLLYRLPVDGTAELDAAELATEVLGVGPSSRLVRRLVRTDQLAQSLSFTVSRLVGGVSTASLTVKAGSGASLVAIEAVLDEELERFAADGPTELEVEIVRAQAERSHLARMASFTTRADEINRYATLFGDPQLVNGVPDGLNQVTAGQMRAAAQTWLAPTNRAVLAYHRESA